MHCCGSEAPRQHAFSAPSKAIAVLHTPRPIDRSSRRRHGAGWHSPADDCCCTGCTVPCTAVGEPRLVPAAAATRTGSATPTTHWCSGTIAAHRTASADSAAWPWVQKGMPNCTCSAGAQQARTAARHRQQAALSTQRKLRSAHLTWRKGELQGIWTGQGSAQRCERIRDVYCC